MEIVFTACVRKYFSIHCKLTLIAIRQYLKNQEISTNHSLLSHKVYPRQFTLKIYRFSRSFFHFHHNQIRNFLNSSASMLSGSITTLRMKNRSTGCKLITVR